MITDELISFNDKEKLLLRRLIKKFSSLLPTKGVYTEGATDQEIIDSVYPLVQGVEGEPAP